MPPQMSTKGRATLSHLALTPPGFRRIIASRNADSSDDRSTDASRLPANVEVGSQPPIAQVEPGNDALARIATCRGLATDQDELSQLRKDVARLTEERDAARRESAKFRALAEDLKEQLVEERGDSTKSSGSFRDRAAARTGSGAIAATPSLPGLSDKALELMFKGLEIIASDLYIHEVVDRVVKITTQMLECERVNLFLADADRQELQVASTAQGLEMPTVAYGKSLVGCCAVSKVVITVNDACADARFNKDVDESTGFRARAMVCIPMLDAKGDLVAVLQAINPIDGSGFTQQEIQLLQCMQMPTSIALLNARLHRSLRYAEESASSLVRVAMVVNAQEQVQESEAVRDFSLAALIEKVVDEAQHRFQAERCSMYVVDHEKDEIWSLVAAGVTERFSVPIGKGISGACAKTGEKINVRDPSKDPRTAQAVAATAGYVMRNTLCAPIFGGQLGAPRVIGVVQLLNKTDAPGYFSSDDEDALGAFCNIVSLAMRNAMIFDELRVKDAEREMMLSSISSFICRFSNEGFMEWCNLPEQLEGVFGINRETLQRTRFDEWPLRIATPGENQVVLSASLAECLATGQHVKATHAELHESLDAQQAGASPKAYFNFTLSPLKQYDAANDQDRHSGALMVLEDISDQHKRIAAEAELASANKRLSELDAVSGLGKFSADLSDTPLQRAINSVQSLQKYHPALRDELNDILAQLTAGDVQLPSLMTDAGKMASMDKFTRDFLAAQSGVELKSAPSTPPSMPRRLSSSSPALVWQDHANKLEEKRTSVAAVAKRRAKRTSTLAALAAAPPGRVRPSIAGMQDITLPPPMTEVKATFKSAGSSSPLARQSSDDDHSESENQVEIGMSPEDWQLPSDTVGHLLSWELDLFTSRRSDTQGASMNELRATAHALLNSQNVNDVLGVSQETVQSFIVAASQGYLPMPFHNFSHAVYVLHGSVMCLTKCTLLQDLLSPLERIAMCIAAIGHDIGHMGVQNSFLANSNDPLALQYNDRSILENMHCSRLFSVLRQKHCGLLDQLKPAQYKIVRKMIIGMIMATDLAQHFDDMTRFKTRMQNSAPWNKESAPDRQMAVEMVLHAADLSGPAQPWSISSVWAGRVQEEFCAQVRCEEELGIPVSTFLMADKAKLETGFIDLFAHPVWEALASLLPEMQGQVKMMATNHERWRCTPNIA